MKLYLKTRTKLKRDAENETESCTRGDKTTDCTENLLSHSLCSRSLSVSLTRTQTLTNFNPMRVCYTFLPTVTTIFLHPCINLCLCAFVCDVPSLFFFLRQLWLRVLEAPHLNVCYQQFTRAHKHTHRHTYTNTLKRSQTMGEYTSLLWESYVRHQILYSRVYVEPLKSWQKSGFFITLTKRTAWKM